MIASTYSHRLAKAGYALGATMILLVIGLWIVGPILIEQAFKGNLLPFLSSVVIAQSIHPLSRVMSAFYELMTPATVLIVWIAVLLAHMTWQGQRVAHAFVDRDAAVSRPCTSCADTVCVCWSTISARATCRSGDCARARSTGS